MNTIDLWNNAKFNLLLRKNIVPLCACNSNHSYSLCCGRYHHNEAIAETPEALMRSRYTAYVMANIEYIKKTMQGKPLDDFNEIEAAHWAKSVYWLGLTVIKSHQDKLDKLHGYVEFKARYLEDNVVKIIHEISEFKNNNNVWYYISGEQKITPSLKITRNSPCPCGSKKKFKHCHALT